MKVLFAIFFIGFWWSSLFLTFAAIAQEQKINLEDVKIEGEALSQSISLSKKDRTDIEKHLKIRRDFREEILGDLPLFLKSRTVKKKRTP